MHISRNPGRVAGLWYLLLCILGPLRLMYIPSKLFVHGNASATVNNIATHQWLFRFGIVADLACAVILIFLGMAFYRLFSGVDKNLAVLVIVFGGVMPSLIDFVGVVSDYGALTLALGSDSLSAFDKPQRDALAYLFVRLHSQGILINEIFWGLWLFPFGLLVFRSGFLPRFIGVWLMINCFGYVALSITALFFPTYYGTAFQWSQPILFGELAIMLWLLIKGAKVPTAPPSALQPAAANLVPG